MAARTKQLLVPAGLDAQAVLSVQHASAPGGHPHGCQHSPAADEWKVGAQLTHSEQLGQVLVCPS